LGRDVQIAGGAFVRGRGLAASFCVLVKSRYDLFQLFYLHIPGFYDFVPLFEFFSAPRGPRLRPTHPYYFIQLHAQLFFLNNPRFCLDGAD